MTLGTCLHAMQVPTLLLAGCFAAPSNVTAGSRDLAGPSAPGLGLGEGLGVTVDPRRMELDPRGIPHSQPRDRALLRE